MEKNNLLVIGFLLVLSISFMVVEEGAQALKEVEHDNFQRGEVLEFKMGYGIFNVGKGKTYISDKLYRVNNRICYKVMVDGRTSGVVDWLAKVDDHWGAYVDTSALVPHMAYRNIKEGKYIKDEITRFDHKAKRISVKDVNTDTGKYNKAKVYESKEAEVRSLLSGFLFIRTLDFEQYAIGDTIALSGFFEDTFYNMKILYGGKGKVKTKLGKINAFKLIPVMPDNSLFDGDNSITAWFSDDKNKIPLKVEADMFIGSAGVEITRAKGLKHPLNYYKK